MKTSKKIASKKIVIMAPLLTLITAVVFVSAYTWGEDNKTNPAAVRSYPTPTIKTIDEPVVGNQGVDQPASDAPVVAPSQRKHCQGCSPG